MGTLIFGLSIWLFLLSAMTIQNYRKVTTRTRNRYERVIIAISMTSGAYDIFGGIALLGAATAVPKLRSLSELWIFIPPVAVFSIRFGAAWLERRILERQPRKRP